MCKIRSPEHQARVVVGKGGLARLVRIPDDLAERFEARRLDEPAPVTDRGIRYVSRYDIGGGSTSRSLSSASLLLSSPPLSTYRFPTTDSC